MSPTFDTKQTAAVVARQEYVADFANFSISNGAIQGTTWNDIDGNGIRAVDGLGGFTEPGLDGWTIFLDLNHNGRAEASEPSTFTDANGNYTFVSVPAGDVEVAEVVPARWYVSTTFDSRQTVSVLAGETVTAREFANFTVLNGSIRGVIWNDLFRDGVRNIAPIELILADSRTDNLIAADRESPPSAATPFAVRPTSVEGPGRKRTPPYFTSPGFRWPLWTAAAERSESSR